MFVRKRQKYPSNDISPSNYKDFPGNEIPIPNSTFWPCMLLKTWLNIEDNWFDFNTGISIKRFKFLTHEHAASNVCCTIVPAPDYSIQFELNLHISL